MSASFAIGGMTCDKCRSRVAEALGRLSQDVTVSRDPPRAVFTAARSIALEDVQEALKGAGKYTASPLDEPITAPEVAVTSWFAAYRPLLIIAAYIAAAAFAGDGARSVSGWMSNFMAGFFLVFSFFKLLDLPGFAGAYAGYDLLAARWRPWGLIYPFAELALGFAYLFRLAPMATNAAALALMAFGSLGVLQALRQRRAIRCACLGTVLNLPMSTVTLVEDTLMATMALAMLAGAH